MAAYLVCLRSAARSAAAPGVMDVRALWEAANVSGQVTSHVRHLPTFQGTSVIPSGRFPSDLKRPIGSLDEGTPDQTQAWHNMSFNVLCLTVRPALLLQHKPCMPRASTKLPHGHRWGAQRFIPSLRPIATLIASSSSLSPQDEIGMAWIQSPLCGARAARKHAWPTSSAQWDSIISKPCLTEASSHDCCFVQALASGVWVLYRLDQTAETISTCWSITEKEAGRAADWMLSVDAAEARNAEGARTSTLRIPSPPCLTGRDAWIQLMSLRVQLAIFPMAVRCKSSNWMSAGFEVQGEALKTYSILVEPNEYFRMTRASWNDISAIRSEALWRSRHFSSNTLSIAGPSRIGAPNRIASLGSTNLKPLRLCGRSAGNWLEISSHLFRLSLRPSSAPNDSTLVTSSATDSKSPPPETSSR